MSAKKRRLDQLKVVSPCSTDWDRMSGDEKKRYCSECDKFVYDFSQMTRRQVEAIVSIHQGRMCARITRRPDGSLVTLEAPPVNPIVARRASPVVNATLAAILGLSVPANALNIDVSAAQLIVRPDADGKSARTPFGGGEAVVGGTVVDPQGAVIPNAEEPATREEGVRKLSAGLSMLKFERERENEDKSESVEAEETAGQSDDDEEDSNEQSDNDDWAEMSRESVRLAAALTQDHKTRLANALFAIAELSEDDLKLVSLIRELGDERLASYLVSQLRRVADRAPRLAESLVWTIAEVINDEDVRRLANDYDDAAEYDESEYDGESDRQDSARNQRADGLTVAAVKRGAMLKDFLKLVEYKTKR